MARVACLAELVPQIEEMDLNPVVCTASDARAVDVRIRLVPRAGRARPRALRGHR